MKTHRPHLGRLIAGLLATLAAAPAQSIVNDFNSSTALDGLVQTSFTDTSQGSFSLSDGRVVYSAPLGGSRLLTLGTAAYNQDWTASLWLRNDAPGNSGPNGIALQVADLNLQFGSMYVGLYQNPDGETRFQTTTGPQTSTLTTFGTAYFTPLVTSEALVRMSNDSTTGRITLGWSLDGGTTYAGTVTLRPETSHWGAGNGGAPWSQQPTAGYTFRLLGYSSGINSVMSADNFSLTPGTTTMVAVPEPSTYAAVAGGLALGFALWRRSRRGRGENHEG
jgi:hypothetical protein